MKVLPDAGPPSRHIFTRFMEKVSIPDDPDGCWEWAGSRDRNGYGSIYDGRRSVLAHRLSMSFAMAPPERHQCVLHWCDNPPCVNPAHLKIGTPADNAHDRVIRDRSGLTKTTVREVRDIRRRLGKGSIGVTDIAQEYGVSYNTVWQIRNGTRWGWLHE